MKLNGLKEHKGVLIQVLVASFVQLFGLLNPLVDSADHRCGDQPGQCQHTQCFGHLAGGHG